MAQLNRFMILISKSESLIARLRLLYTRFDPVDHKSYSHFGVLTSDCFYEYSKSHLYRGLQIEPLYKAG
jgi:hypothetical protein